MFATRKHWALLDLNKSSQRMMDKALSENTPNRVGPELGMLMQKWDSLTDIEKQLIMKLLK